MSQHDTPGISCKTIMLGAQPGVTVCVGLSSHCSSGQQLTN
jgi:hypothetical protein